MQVLVTFCIVCSLQNQTNTYPSCCGILARNRGNQDILLVQFSDVRDAAQAYEDARMAHWLVTFLNPKALGFEATQDNGPNGPFRNISNFEGQLKAQVLFNPQDHTLTASFVVSLIKKTLGKYGEVKAIRSTPCGIPHVKAYCIEFYDIRSAAAAHAALSGKDIGVSLFDVQSLLTGTDFFTA